jgi:hypothetical protein
VAQRNYGDGRSLGVGDASFVKFREFAARYSLPSSFVGRMGANRGSLTVSGRELGLVWRKEPYIWGSKMMSDPEITDRFRSTPPLTRWSAELNFSL